MNDNEWWAYLRFQTQKRFQGHVQKESYCVFWWRITNWRHKFLNILSQNPKPLVLTDIIHGFLRQWIMSLKGIVGCLERWNMTYSDWWNLYIPFDISGIGTEAWATEKSRKKIAGSYIDSTLPMWQDISRIMIWQRKVEIHRNLVWFFERGFFMTYIDGYTWLMTVIWIFTLRKWISQVSILFEGSSRLCVWWSSVSLSLKSIQSVLLFLRHMSHPM